MSTFRDENLTIRHKILDHHFFKKTTFWSETGFGPLLGTSRRLASSECDFEHFSMYHIFTYLGKFDRWPIFDPALILDAHGQFVFLIAQPIRLDETHKTGQ